VISAIVLAAGAGRRFGGTKQVARVRGKPLAQHAVDAAAEAGLGEVIVVLGHDAETVRAALHLPATGRCVVNPAHSTGMASSLAVGLEHADPASDAAIVLLADQPGITGQHVRALVDAYEARRSPIVRLAFRSGPGPSLIARELWPDVAALEGDVGARALIEARPELVEEVDLSGDAPTDVDVPEDLERA
jgi:molybdenum cofactor cytidylyltransferase